MACLVVLCASVASAAGAAGSLWNIAKVGAPAPADGVLIAVVDSGVDAAHPAFGGRVVEQRDFTGDGKNGDPVGHGTHVAGTAAGGTIDCGKGPAAIGVAPTARLLSVRVFDESRSASTSDVANGIRYAADRGADVINLSLGDDLTVVDGGSQVLLDAIEYAWSKGSIPVLSSGNDRVFSIFASGYGDISAVIVTATTRQDRRAAYARAVGSARWGIAAPGGDASGTAEGDVLSAYPGNRCTVSAGTSMAAPHVAGALAVLRADGLSPRQAVERLLSTARDIGPSSTYGAGLLDLAAARRTSAPAAPTTVAPTTATPKPAASSTGDGAPPSSAGTTPIAPSSATPDGADGPSPTGEPPPASVTTGPATEPAVSVPETVDSSPFSEGDDETASDLNVIRDEDDGGVPTALAVAGGVALLAGWVLVLRGAGRLRQPSVSRQP